MSQHTPGPWEAHIEDDWIAISACGDSTICEYRADPMEDDAAAPDARLMAAAPELLAFAEAFIEMFQSVDMRPEDECHELLGKAVDAIAKATGGSP